MAVMIQPIVSRNIVFCTSVAKSVQPILEQLLHRQCSKCGVFNTTKDTAITHPEDKTAGNALHFDMETSTNYAARRSLARVHKPLAFSPHSCGEKVKRL